MAVTGILGKKIGMTQVFDEQGNVHPITVLQAGPCVITQLKTMAKDGYDAAQIGLVEFVKASKVTKPQAGHFAKNSIAPVRMIKEVGVEAIKPVAEGEEAEVGVKAGDRVLVDIFSDEKYVDVVGTSKGRGFSGVVRRHNFGGGPKSHGHMFQVQGSAPPAFRRVCSQVSGCRVISASTAPRFATYASAASISKRTSSWSRVQCRVHAMGS
jgi:large subunit ribosomal protein L3